MESTFQKRLIEGMKLCGFRQADLATKTGLSKSRISHYVSGRYEAKPDALYLIAKALGVSEAWLMGHDVPQERGLSEKEAELSKETETFDLIEMNFGKPVCNLVSDFLQLNKEGQQIAIDYIDYLSGQEKYTQERKE